MNCKYFNEHMLTILEYCKCLYRLKDCAAGGPLHILLDDCNYSDDDIDFCMVECLKNQEHEGSDLGLLICRELSKLSLYERGAFIKMWSDEGCECDKLGWCLTCSVTMEEN